MRTMLAFIFSVMCLGTSAQELPSDSIPEDTLYAIMLDKYRYPKVDGVNVWRTPAYYDRLLYLIEREKGIEFYARFLSPTTVLLKSPRTGEVNTYDFNDSVEAASIVVPKDECVRRLRDWYGEDTLVMLDQRYHVGDTIYLRQNNYRYNAINAAGFKDFSKIKHDGKLYDVYKGETWESRLPYSKSIFTGFVTMPVYDKQTRTETVVRDKFGTRYGYYATFAYAGGKISESQKECIGDTIYMPVEKGEFLAYAVTPSEHKAIIDSIERANHAEAELWNFAMRATYNTAKDRWGKRIADLINQGRVEFGFTPEMVIEAKHLQTGQAYDCYRERTPLGYATVYDFQDGDKFYFINKKLIGVKWRGQPTKYQRRKR